MLIICSIRCPDKTRKNGRNQEESYRNERMVAGRNDGNGRKRETAGGRSPRDRRVASEVREEGRRRSYAGEGVTVAGKNGAGIAGRREEDGVSRRLGLGILKTTRKRGVGVLILISHACLKVVHLAPSSLLLITQSPQFSKPVNRRLNEQLNEQLNELVKTR